MGEKNSQTLERKIQIEFNSFKKWMELYNWDQVLRISFMHFGAIFGLYYLFSGKARIYTYIWAYFVFILGGIGIGLASHRYFCHRSFKAVRGLHIFLIFCQSTFGMFNILHFNQLHRVHHKYADTNADPTNINRGFWFAHLFWVFHYNPECKKALEAAYIKDCLEDKDIMFQVKYFYPVSFICCIALPSILPCILWNESLWISFWINAFRWCSNWNQFTCGNTIMHLYGTRPYSKNISATNGLFQVIFTFGEGYHNYHHVFPWDYKGAEFGDFLHFNLVAILIDLWAKAGWVYDQKVVTQDMINRRVAKTGDGSHWLFSEEVRKNPVWGYGDSDMDVDDKMELTEENNKNNLFT